jgi:hypothetical protein
MLTAIDIRYTGAAAAIRNRRVMGELKKAAHAEVGERWGERMRPKHFTHAGAREYGYEPRTASYRGRKRKAKGHMRPLVWSGTLESETEGFTTLPSTRGAKVRVPGRALNLTNIPNSRINIREEMSTVSRRERGELADHGTRQLTRLVNTYKGRRATRL